MVALDTASDVRGKVAWTFALIALTGSLSTPCTSTMVNDDPQPVVSRVATSVGEFSFSEQRNMVYPQVETRFTVGELREYSGLTASQIGRMFGVSRRSVNNWMAGGPMASQHVERLSTIEQVVRSLPGRTAEERRAELLASSSGPSLFQQLVNEISPDVLLQMNPLAARDQF